MVISFACRILVQNVPAGVTNNPMITISNLPSDIPAFNGVGSLTQKGTDSTEVGDGCQFGHSANSTTMTLTSFNFMGTARAGWVCYTVPGVY